MRRLKTSDLIKDGKNIPVPFYQIHHPLSPFSESMRTLRSSIHMSDVDHPPRVIQVTSALPGEGKTTIAVSLAISAAVAGLKVALVDADLRHPATSRFFKLDKENGLVDLLTGVGSTENALRVYKDLKLTILPSGSKSLNPPDVLGSERMKALIVQLKETFDYVVVDSPPVGPVVFAVIVANLADKPILAVEIAASDPPRTDRDHSKTSVGAKACCRYRLQFCQPRSRQEIWWRILPPQSITKNTIPNKRCVLDAVTRTNSILNFVAP